MIKPFVSFDSIIGGKSEDVFIFFDNTMTTMPVKGKTIALLHDIIPLRMAGVFKWEDFFRKNAKNVVKNATRIVTVSEYSKKDIVEVLHADPDKIDVVYSAVDPEIFSREKTSAEKFRALRKKYGLPEKYILHFGSCLPQKNVPALIRAYSM
ncbi:MAG: glycosyltransferase, partial [Synergistaceae bacterium]|nr:glycosyltransferase [Synergistaceae bacterium]